MQRKVILVVSVILIVLCILGSSPTNVNSQDATESATAAATETSSSPPDFHEYIAQVVNAEPIIIKSADGRATLLIPPDALPPDTRIAEIKITTLSAAQAPLTTDKQRPLFAYQLDPDGLQFTQPALLQILTDLPAHASSPMLYTISGEVAEPVTPIITDLDAKSKKLFVTAALNHFSVVAGTDGWFTITVSYPGDHLVGTVFPVTAVVALEPAGVYPVVSWKLRGGWNTYNDPGLRPTIVTDSPPTTAMSNTRSFTVTQNFTCLRAGFHEIRYLAVLDIERRNRFGPGTNTVKVFDLNTDSKSFRCLSLIRKLTAQFVPAERSTYYTVTTYNPEGTTPLTYQWTNSNACGTFTATTTSPKAIWHHPHTSIGGTCPDEESHPGTISVTVSAGATISETIAYEYGSDTGSISPPDPATYWTFTPIVPTPPVSPPKK